MLLCCFVRSRFVCAVCRRAAAAAALRSLPPNRRRQVIDVLHPNKATVSKKDLKEILAKEYKVNGEGTEQTREESG